MARRPACSISWTALALRHVGVEDESTYVEDFTTVLRSRAEAAGMSRAFVFSI